MKFQIAALAVSAGVAMVVASCGGTEATRPPEESAAPAATRAPAMAAPVPADDGLVADAVTIKDPKNDLVNEDGRKVKRVPQIDITRLYAWANGTDLRITLRLAGNVPKDMSSVSQELNYLVVIEADESGEYDYWVMLTNLEDGSWSVALSDWATGLSQSDEKFPGYHVIAKNEVSFPYP